MIIKTAEFVLSNTDVDKCPKQDLPEYAFIGRSNVGKSSLINMLVNNNKLAKTSQSPGKTRLINHFIVNSEWYLVDLPGYGFAKTSKKNREAWEKMIAAYITKRENIVTIFVLIDCRIPPQKIDLEFINWMGEKGIPITLVFTKMDKVSQRESSKNIKLFKTELLKSWEAVPTSFTSSAKEKTGRDKLLDFISVLNKEWHL